MSLAAGINLDEFAPEVAFPGRAEHSSDESADWSTAEDDDDEESFSEKMRRQIEDDDPDLTRLDLGFDGYIPHDGDWEELGRKIGRSKHLKEMLFYDLDDGVISEDFAPLFRGMARNRSIRRLSLRRCGLFDSDTFRTLTPLFRGSHGFESLRVSDCDLGREGLRLLTAAVAGFDSLREFELSRCGIDNDGSYIRALAGHSGLRKLVLRVNCIGRIGCASLAALIKKPDNELDELVLADNGFDDECFVVFAAGLTKNSSLKDLDLSRNHHITEIGWSAVFDALKSPICKLEKLYLQESGINDVPTRSLAMALAGNSTIKTLGLSSCRSITSASWSAFLGFLRGPFCILEELHLLSNGFRNDATHSLADSLSSNSSLRILNLSANVDIELSGWQASGWQAFSFALNSPCSMLTSLDLSYNQINDEAAMSIGNALANNSRLMNLKLCHNPLISTLGWRAFSAALRNPGSALQKLDLTGNPMNDETMISLASSLAKNTKLAELITHFINWNITMHGWAALARVLCNETNINRTYESNHTLCRFCGKGTEAVLPIHVRSLLVLNRKKSRSQAARIKIISCHFGGNFGLWPFMDMELEVLPYAFAWVAKQYVGEIEEVEVGGISLLYRFVRIMHLLIGFSCESKIDTAGPKRKRQKMVEE